MVLGWKWILVGGQLIEIIPEIRALGAPNTNTQKASEGKEERRRREAFEVCGGDEGARGPKPLRPIPRAFLFGLTFGGMDSRGRRVSRRSGAGQPRRGRSDRLSFSIPGVGRGDGGWGVSRTWRRARGSTGRRRGRCRRPGGRRRRRGGRRRCRRGGARTAAGRGTRPGAGWPPSAHGQACRHTSAERHREGWREIERKRDGIAWDLRIFHEK